MVLKEMLNAVTPVASHNATIPLASVRFQGGASAALQSGLIVHAQQHQANSHAMDSALAVGTLGRHGHRGHARRLNFLA